MCAPKWIWVRAYSAIKSRRVYPPFAERDNAYYRSATEIPYTCIPCSLAKYVPVAPATSHGFHTAGRYIGSEQSLSFGANKHRRMIMRLLQRITSEVRVPPSISETTRTADRTRSAADPNGDLRGKHWKSEREPFRVWKEPLRSPCRALRSFEREPENLFYCLQTARGCLGGCASIRYIITL